MRNKHVRSLISVILITILTLTLSACSLLQQEKITVSWFDAEGVLIDYGQFNKDEDPAQRELPQDTDQRHYTGWQVNAAGNEIRCTAQWEPKVVLQWQDSDGNVLNTQYVAAEDANADLYSLPEDTDKWHYTHWTEKTTEEGFVYTAQRVQFIHHIYNHTDGTLLEEITVPEGEEPEAPALPEDTDKWHYTEWAGDEEEDGTNIYTAQREINSTYFSGNVFQIVAFDVDGEPLSTGSGFILNQEGWFITNFHVLDECASGKAYFDIPDDETGSRYTNLEIIGGVYYNEESDVFIGKLDGYRKLASYYHDIAMTESFTTGERCYAVGYPNSSVNMEISEGSILEEYSNIIDKLNDVYYVLFDSYVAPGSSGGILINDNFDVIGITTIAFYSDNAKTEFESGGAIPVSIFKNHITKLDESELISLDVINQQTMSEGEPK